MDAAILAPLHRAAKDLQLTSLSFHSVRWSHAAPNPCSQISSALRAMAQLCCLHICNAAYIHITSLSACQQLQALHVGDTLLDCPLGPHEQQLDIPLLESDSQVHQ